MFFDTRVSYSTSDSRPVSVRCWILQSKCEPHGFWIVGLIYVAFLDWTVVLRMNPGQLWRIVPSEVNITEHDNFIWCDPTRVLTNDSIDRNFWWTCWIGICWTTIFKYQYQINPTNFFSNPTRWSNGVLLEWQKSVSGPSRVWALTLGVHK